MGHSFPNTTKKLLQMATEQMNTEPVVDDKQHMYTFNADIQQLIGLIINTFYSNKEIFIRELISNSSDALDKIRCKSIVDPDSAGLDVEKDFKIQIIPDTKKKLEEQKAAFEGLCTLIKEVLGDKIEKCLVGTRMQESPCVLVTSEWGWSANMERIMKAQALRDSSMSSYMVSKRTLEINPEHSIVVELKKRADADKSDRTVKDLIWLLYETSLLTSGFSLDEPTSFGSRIHRMIKFALTIQEDEKVEEEEMPGLVEDNEAPQESNTRMEDID